MGLIKTLLREGLFNKHSKEHVDLMNDFITFACEYLKIPKGKVIIQYNRDGLVTTAAYGNKIVKVYGKERAIVDIMRSIAHELTHMKQDIEGNLNPNNHKDNNEAGSPIENEANYKAGEIIRKFGEKYPKIYT
jgi:Zn-dependent peptidase ImmA (M78 family)